MTNLVNFLLFQTAWFVCVSGAAHGQAWVGPLAGAGVAFVRVRMAGAPRRGEAAFLLIAALAGGLLDTAICLSGAYAFAPGVMPPWLMPAWFGALWVAFASTFGMSLGWIGGRLRLAALLGAIGGPLAYLAGERLGAVRFGDHAGWVLALLGAVWAAAMPLLLVLRARLTRG